MNSSSSNIIDINNRELGDVLHVVLLFVLLFCVVVLVVVAGVQSSLLSRCIVALIFSCCCSCSCSCYCCRWCAVIVFFFVVVRRSSSSCHPSTKKCSSVNGSATSPTLGTSGRRSRHTLLALLSSSHTQFNLHRHVINVNSLHTLPGWFINYITSTLL